MYKTAIRNKKNLAVDRLCVSVPKGEVCLDVLDYDANFRKLRFWKWRLEHNIEAIKYWAILVYYLLMYPNVILLQNESYNVTFKLVNIYLLRGRMCVSI